MMNTQSLRFAAWLLTAVAVISGCECGTRTRKQYGDIGVVVLVDGVEVIDRDGTYDFGPVFMGQTGTLKMQIRNRGAGSLGLDRIEKSEGTPSVSVGLTDPNDSTFHIAFETKDIGISETAEFEMAFHAPIDDTQKVVNHEVTLVLRGLNTEPGKELSTITLKGQAVSGVCALPKQIDFGAVAKGDSMTTVVELRNPTNLDATAMVGDIEGSDKNNFQFSPDSPHGTVNIPPGEKREVKIVFTPTDLRQYFAHVKMQAEAACPVFDVRLVGEGVDQVLVWDPKELKFGYVPPNITTFAEVTLINRGIAPVKLSGVLTTPSGEYKVVEEDGFDANNFVVPGKADNEGKRKLKISFKPSVLGPRAGQLKFNTTLARQPSAVVPLIGYGGGPDIQVIPAPLLNFGKIPYFASANPPVYQVRKLSILNVGTKGQTQEDIANGVANLKLGVGGSKPYFDVKAVGASTDISEIEIPEPPTTGPKGYDEAKGIEATAGKNVVELAVKITPKSLGPKEFEIIIFSNDPDEQETKVTIKAEAALFPPCNYSVVPTALNYGLLTPPDYKDLTFTVKNLGLGVNDKCFISNLDISPGADPAFSLPAGAISQKELNAGESLNVTVRAWPQGQVPPNIQQINGDAQMFISSPTQPEALINLKASIASSCLTIAPDDLDFGTVKVSAPPNRCHSPPRQFNIYNTCSTPVTLNGFAVQAGAGQPAGGPNCPGTQPCPEFELTSTPAIPGGGLVLNAGGAPVTFSARYSPIDFGSDQGAIAVNAVQGGQPVTYIVTVQGKGDADGLNTDTFTQDAKPKADILLTIDNSCSMSDKQQSLANNFASFIKYAQSAAVDYQIAVTTTDDSSTGQKGEFVSGAGHPEKIITPTTADYVNKFKAKVNVGIMGSATESGLSPSLKALTAPLINGPNAGFIRQAAALAVVVVTDAPDQSANTVPFYFDSFLNIKGKSRANMFTFNAVAGFNPTPPTGCVYDMGADDGRYAAMVSQTNGVKEEICTADWSKALEKLGKTAFGFRTTFFLNGIPDPARLNDIVVKIDGVNVPKTDSRGALVWKYSTVANAIEFEPMFVPEPGQTLTITYYVACN